MATPVPRIGCAHFCRTTILALNRRKQEAASGAVYPHEGAVDFINNVVNSNTGTLEVRGVFPNSHIGKGPERMLKPGMFVRIRVPIGDAHSALLVPQDRRKPPSGGRRRRRIALFGMDAAGRWSRVARPGEVVRLRRRWLTAFRNRCGFRELRFAHIDGVGHQGSAAR